MIENIRKYTGLMIVVLVLLFVGLVFLGDTARNSFAGKPVMEVNGVAVSQKEFQRLALNALEIPAALTQSGPLSQPSRVAAAHYLGEDILNNPQVSAGYILQNMTLFLQPDDPTRFLANRIAVREAGLEFGATPGPDEVEAFIEKVLFADNDGNFDQVAFSEFMEKKIGRLGIGSRGFNEYVRDLLTAQNLAKILGAGIVSDTSAAAAHYSLDKQTIAAEQVTLDMLDFEADLKPTEEEIKAYFEENQENYYSDELRKATYVFVEPDWDAELAKQEAADQAKKEAAEKAKKAAEEAKKKAEAEKKEVEKKAAEAAPEKATEAAKPADTTSAESTETSPEKPDESTEAPEKPTEEGEQGDPGSQGEPAPDAPESEKTPAPVSEEAPAANEEAKPPVVTETKPETPAKPDPKTPETKPAPTPVKPPEKLAKDKLSFQNKEAAVKALANSVDDLYQALLDDNGKNFEDHAAELKFEVKTTELFSLNKPPKDLDRAISGGSVSKPAEAIFERPVDGDPDEKMTDPYRTNEGWFIGRLDEVVEAVPLTFEEAKVRATVDLKKKLAREKMIARAKELHEKLNAGVTEGKSFEEAAKAIDEKLVVSKVPNLAMPDLSGIPIQYRAQFAQPAPPAFQAAQFVNPGKIAEVKFTPSEENPEKALIVYVDKREVTVDDAYTSQLNQQKDGQAGIARYLVFQNWLFEQYEQNQVIRLKTEQQ